MRPRALAAAALLLLGVALVATPMAASGQEAAPVLLVRSVDSADPAATEVTYLYTGSSSDAASATLTENGQATGADAAPLPDETRLNVALLFDTSAAMDGGGGLVEAKAAARQVVESRTAAEQTSVRFAVYIMGPTAVRLQGFTTNTNRILTAIDNVAPTPVEGQEEQTALWDGIIVAANDAAEETGQANLVVMTGQSDTTGASAAAARGAVSNAAAVVFAIEYTASGFDTGSLDELVDVAGGQVITAGDGSGVADGVTAAGSTILEGQYQFVYATGVPQGEVADLTVEAGGVTDSVVAVVGTLTEGNQALHAVGSVDSGGIGFLQSPLGLLLGVILVLVAAGGLAYALALLFIKDDDLTNVLRPYAEPGLEDGDGESDALAQSALLQRAVQITEQVAADRGLLARTEAALERANLPLRAGEALFFYFAAVIVLTILFMALTGSLFTAVVVGVVTAMVPVAALNLTAGLRKKKFMSQLPDTLQLLSGTLRAGYSLMQGVEAVSQEVDEPMGLELRRVVTESRLGRPLEEALEGTAERMGSPDFAWAVMAIRIQREVGGNLSELLMTVADTMVARERLRRDVAALTAEGRVSAIVLGILPVGLGFAMYVLNPEYIARLFETTIGNILLGVAGVSMLIGFAWMRKIINIEI